MTEAAREGRLVVISGPSGVGKTTICAALRKLPGVVKSVSATTRAPRPGEADGKDYFFLSKEEFVRRRDRGAFLEWAEYAGNQYGTPKEYIEKETRAGNFPMLDIDVQGVEQLRRLGWKGIYVFLSPPSIEELRKRLVKRGMSGDDIARRVKQAEGELKRTDLYDFTVVNDVVDRAIAEVREILDRHFYRKEPT